MPTDLGNFYNLTQTETNTAVVVFNILFAFLLAYCIVWTWRKTHHGLSYSQSFAFTLIMLAPLSATVMMIVKNNLIGAFALLGAFAFIRFRTIMKETRDIAFLFFSLTIGVATGTNNYAIAIVATFLICVMILYLWKKNFGSAHEKIGFVLTVRTDSGFRGENLRAVFEKHFRKFELLHANTEADAHEYAYAIHFKDESHAAALLQDLKQTNGVRSTYLITGKETIEY
ncbi:MAG: hypothetical protein G01um101470_446 [Parcubacteria group bacterium Gr01-1014_70]|nr:MAG: hypothetical protein G01um101470_446 [Parcubacteria group bacterium Gr01-1014_70]